METPDTLSQITNRLKQQGYSEDLNLHANNPLWIDPNSYSVDEIFRFETVRRSGATIPDDESILYALSSVKYKTKGLLVNGYGPSADVDPARLEQRMHRWPVE
ncbi:MAG: hypothetical protein JWP57_2008 [Spirosoma sp.]|nr:hypothetical protein [Spirosoma sp.]